MSNFPLPVLDHDRLPAHIAVIMDGNGRWAQDKGQDRVAGHYEGVISVREIVNECGALGIGYLTLYAFSTENWNRPKQEVDALMELLVNTIRKEVDELKQKNVRMHVIGNFSDLPLICQKELKEAIEITSDNNGLNLILALSYSSKWEISEAIKKIALEVKNNTLSVDNIDDSAIRRHLTTASFPDPELMIRTGGEHRISNFLLYQLAYAELYFTNAHWPAFRKKELFEALHSYQNRERRFGMTSEQIKNQEIL